MNAWNQWGAAGYAAAIPGYAAPQATAAPAIPTAAAALPQAAAAAAAVPYPGVAGFQTWPYTAAATPQALAPWTPGAGATAGQTAQWEQWQQWQQQYAQWQQQQYAAQTAVSTQQTTTPPAKAVEGVQPAGSSGLTMTTNTTVSASMSGNVKRPNDTSADSLNDPKKARISEQSWNQQAATVTTSSDSTITPKEFEEMSQSEKQFDEHFKDWEAQFNAWRQQNANHPDIEQYKAYEAKWTAWRDQLVARREHMKKKREKTIDQTASAQPKPAEPLALPPDPTAVLNPAATAMTQMYPGYVAPATVANSHYPGQYGQAQFMASYSMPAAASTLPQTTPVLPGQNASAGGTGGPAQSEFLKSSSSNGIPGLDLLSGGSSQADTKATPAVSFASSTTNMPIQTPADSKPFDFPPRQTPASTTQSQPGYSGHPAGLPSGGMPPMGFPGMMQPGFPFPGQSQAPGWPGYQGAAPGAYQPPSTGYPTGTTPTGPSQAPVGGYQQPGFQGFQGQPPPGFQPSMAGFMPPNSTSYPNSFPPNGPPQGNAPPQGFQNQQGPPGNFPETSKPGNFPYNQQPPSIGGQGPHPNFPNNNEPKKLPGLMDNFSGYGDRSNLDRIDNFGRNVDDKFNKFPQDRFGNQDKFGDHNRIGNKDMSFNLPKPKGYFSMQEMTEEEEYEKFHEYQQKGDDEEQENNRYNDKFGKQSRFDRPSPSKFQEGGPRFEEGRPQNLADASRPSRFDGGRLSRFEQQSPNRFPSDMNNFNRPPFEAEEKRPPLLGNAPPSMVPPVKDSIRSSRWGGPEEDRELEKGPGRSGPDRVPLERGEERNISLDRDNKEKPYGLGGGLGPPYGATPDGSDFRFAVIINYNHTAANLGVPDYFEPVSIIDYTHGLEGIKVKEPIDEDWDKGKTAGPHARSRDERESPRDDRLRHERDRELDDRRNWRLEDRRGPMDDRRGHPDDRRDRGPLDDRRDRGPDDRRDRGPFDDRRDRGPLEDRRGLFDDRRDRGPEDRRDRGPDDRRDRGPDDRRDRGPPDDRRDRGPDDRRDRGPPDDRRDRGPPDDRRNRGPPDDRRDKGGPPDDRRGPPPMSRWSEHDDRDRRKDNAYNRSPDRSRPNDRLGSSRDDRDRRDRNVESRDRDNRSRSPRDKQGGAGPQDDPVPQPQVPKEILPIDDLLVEPGRTTRPPKIAIFLRGAPGSGKSFVAKLIKDKEISNGGTAPRILSLDDYFMVDVEKEIPDPDTGRLTKKNMLEYEYDGSMEVKYRESLNKCFRKTVTDGYFPFIIVDANNDKISYFDSMINFCKVRGFSFYVIELEQDVAQCTKRNVHKRTEKDIEGLIKGFEPSPSSFPFLDITSLLQDASISEVDMEDSMDVATPEQPEKQEKPVEKEEEKKKEETKEPDKPEDKPRTIGSMGGPLLRNPGPPFKTGSRFQTRPPMFHNPQQWGGPRRGFGGPMWRSAPNRRR